MLNPASVYINNNLLAVYVLKSGQDGVSVHACLAVVLTRIQAHARTQTYTCLDLIDFITDKQATNCRCNLLGN